MLLLVDSVNLTPYHWSLITAVNIKSGASLHPHSKQLPPFLFDPRSTTMVMLHLVLTLQIRRLMQFLKPFACSLWLASATCYIVSQCFITNIPNKRTFWVWAPWSPPSQSSPSARHSSVCQLRSAMWLRHDIIHTDLWADPSRVTLATYITLIIVVTRDQYHRNLCFGKHY